MSTTAIMLSGAPVISAAVAPAMGSINSYNASSGTLSITLPPLSTKNVGANCIVEKSAADLSSNAINFICHGSDTFDDSSVSVALTDTFQKFTLQVIQISGAKFWKITNISPAPGGGGGGGSSLLSDIDGGSAGTVYEVSFTIDGGSAGTVYSISSTIDGGSA
jgi:hypothetical protein